MPRASVEVFDQWAPSYDAGALQPVLYTPMHATVLGRAARLVDSPARVLDVGCGTGRLLGWARRVFPEAVLVGVDSSPTMLATARAGWTWGPSARFVRARAERLPFPDASFELVLSTVSYRHWSDRAAGLREIGRILAPGGILALADIFAPRRRARMSVLARAGRADLPEELAEALAPARLSTVGVEVVPGFGPVASVTVVTARRRSQAAV